MSHLDRKTKALPALDDELLALIFSLMPGNSIKLAVQVPALRPAVMTTLLLTPIGVAGCSGSP